VTDRKPSVDAAIDLLVYAPLGFALEARGLLPKFVERGRNQVTMARMVGQFAVQQGQVEAARRLGPLQEQVEAVLVDLGVVPRPAPTRPEPGPTTEPAVRVVPDPEPEVDSAPTEPSVPADDLAIPDYDSLAASQVVPRLRGLDPEELEQVRRYELAHRGRKTILNRVAQLQDG